MNAILSNSPRSLLQYMKDEIGLTIVMAVILVLIVALAILLAVQIVREKRKKEQNAREETSPAPPGDKPAAEEPLSPSEEAEPAERDPAESEAEADGAQKTAAESGAENTEDGNRPPKAESAEAAEKRIKPEEEEPMKKKGPIAAPAKEQKAAPKKEPKQKAVSKPTVLSSKPPVPPKAAVVPPKTANGGKWIIFAEERGGYGFKLVASNGEVMLLSSAPYASLQSAKSGVKTYQDNVKAGRLEIAETKSGSFFVKINNASGRLLATSADYKTRSSAESAAESIKRWAETTVILVEEEPDEKK